jgi:hypothetical protein
MAEDSSKNKVGTTLAPGMKALFDQCLARNIYGDQAATVRQFVNTGLERLIDQGRLIDVPGLVTPITSKDGESDEKKEGE